MKRGNNRAKEITMEIVVGTFIFMVLLALSIFTIVLSSGSIFRAGTRIEVVFPDVMGLRDGDNVVIRGMVVGSVKELGLGPDGVHVIAVVDAKYTLNMREDYSVRIMATSVLGGRVMEISEGTTNAPPVANIEKYVFKGSAPSDLMDAATKAIDEINNALHDGRVIENIQVTMANIRDISEKINEGQGTVGKLINDPGLYTDAQEIVSEIKMALTEREMLKNIEESVANINLIAGKINEGDGTVAKLINDPALYNEALEAIEGVKRLVMDPDLSANLGGTLTNLKNITDKINEGEGTIGKLINDPELYEEIKRLVIEARATVDDFREMSPILTFSSIFLGAF